MKFKSLSISLAWLILTILLLVVIAAIAWANLQWVDHLPRESDFLYQWQITRGLIFNRTNPYQPITGYTFKAPFPILVFYFPFALIENYEFARALWITALQITTVVFAYLCIRNTAWIRSLWLASVLFLFALLWFPAVSIYVNGSAAPLMAMFFAAALLAIQKGQDEVAGVFLALSALELRLTLLAVVLLLLWIAAHRRWITYFWAAVTFLFTNIIGMIFLPSWPVDFARATYQLTDFRIGQAIIATTTRWWPGIGTQIGWGIVIIAAVLLIVEWWLVWGKSDKRLTWTLALTWVLTIWVGFETNIDQVFLLIFALIVIFAAWNRRWGKLGSAFTLAAMLLLLPGLWWAAIFFAKRGIAETSNPIFMMAFPLLIIIALYWIRWWYLRPEYLNLSEV